MHFIGTSSIILLISTWCVHCVGFYACGPSDFLISKKKKYSCSNYMIYCFRCCHYHSCLVTDLNRQHISWNRVHSVHSGSQCHYHRHPRGRLEIDGFGRLGTWHLSPRRIFLKAWVKCSFSFLLRHSSRLLPDSSERSVFLAADKSDLDEPWVQEQQCHGVSFLTDVLMSD